MNYVSLKYPLSYDALLPNGITNKNCNGMEWCMIFRNRNEQVNLKVLDGSCRILKGSFPYLE